jgi:hypothetical protein
MVKDPREDGWSNVAKLGVVVSGIVILGAVVLGAILGLSAAGS